MTTYAFPAVTPNAISWRLVSNTARQVSIFTGATKTLGRTGERWALNMSFHGLKKADRALLASFLAKLNGVENRFTFADPSHTQQGAFGGTPLIMGGAQAGNSVDIDGCSLSITDWIKAGDYFSINDELKMATADASSDGSGEITVAFTPRIRNSPVDNSAVVTASPTGVFMLDTNQSGWSATPGDFSTFVIAATEDIAI